MALQARSSLVFGFSVQEFAKAFVFNFVVEIFWKLNTVLYTHTTHNGRPVV